ncbi:MAG: 3-phosphoshikimate 1-carboxyvinyltransferase [Oscillospiraceae bacterium]|nr:3-phosphoshikimate 1-carboxyvinyltransferase [Oscillospiraceae bacterium]
MIVTIVAPTKLKGAITPPPSKSQAHRLLIAAALAEGESVISNVQLSKDIVATMDCLEELGARFSREGTTVTVTGMGANSMSPNRRLALPRLDCGESGSTLRFLIPIALAVRGGGIFTGHGRLMERPQDPYFDLFKEKGIFFEQKDGELTVQGRLEPGEYRLPGNVSSQFFTGLLFALPLLNGPSAIIPTTELESEDYIRMTAEVLERFGVRTAATMSLPPQYHVLGSQTYTPAQAAVESDWSQAGFWYAAKALDNSVDIISMNPNSSQGDKIVAEHYVNLSKPGDLTIDVSGCPDLVPPLAAMATVRQGTTHLVNAARLRIKESDRLAAVTDVLCKLGAKATEGPDFLDIEGLSTLPGGVEVDAHNDHRIAMMAAVAATACQKPITVTGGECVSKSYPNFWEDYVNLGGQIKRTYAMTIEPITPDNWREAVFLTTDPERKNPLDQEWLCNNAFSLLQTFYEPEWTSRLILGDGKPVGFAFFGAWDEKGGAPLLCRYMIDVDCQGKGYGAQALPIVLEEMYRVYGRREIYLTVEQANERAVRMYEKFGFRFTGEMDYEEAIYILPAPEA